VDDGWVTLDGEVEWMYQKVIPENDVRHLKGVRGITNNISIKPKAEPKSIRVEIQKAFERNARIDAEKISVEAQGGKVILRGTVRSWAEREEAEDIAWGAAGVSTVKNEITVSPLLATKRLQSYQ